MSTCRIFLSITITKSNNNKQHYKHNQPKKRKQIQRTNALLPMERRNIRSNSNRHRHQHTNNIRTRKPKQQPDTNGEWRYNRSVFFERNHKHIKVTFKNTSKKPVYIDGIRIWKHDFEEWKPAQEDI